MNEVYRTEEEFLKNYKDSYLMHKKHISFNPMTLEGCVVKLSDVISYSGRDLEDAIRLDVIKSKMYQKTLLEY